MKVARDGEAAQPRTPAPTALRPLFRLTRPTPAAYRTITEVVDADEEFRVRVAEEAAEDLVGRAGWLWLTRPEGWESDPVFDDASEAGSDHSGPSADASADLDGEDASKDNDSRPGGGVPSRVVSRLEEKLARANEALAQARDKAERSSSRARQLSEEVVELTADRDRWKEEAARAREERLDAVRQLKAAQAERDVTRRDLKEARRAVAEAEEQVRNLTSDRGHPTPDRSSSANSVGNPDPASPLADPGPREPDEMFDRAAARRSVAAAASAASALAQALAETAAALQDRPTTTAGTGPARSAATVPTGGGESRPRRAAGRRRQPTVPPGLFSDSPEAQRSLVADPAVTVVVDGYNLARTLWSGLEPEEERRRTVGLLDEAALRGGAPFTVVFDGDDREVSPVASRVVRVLYSSEGRTADEEIAALVPRIPADQPVLVVSSDREVATAAVANGAVTLSSSEFLAAIGR